MSKINKSATLLGTLVFANGNTNEIFVGFNRNTGSTIVWQSATINGKGQRASRLTGENIAKFFDEVAIVLKERGNDAWQDCTVNDKLLAQMMMGHWS